MSKETIKIQWQGKDLVCSATRDRTTYIVDAAGLPFEPSDMQGGATVNSLPVCEVLTTVGQNGTTHALTVGFAGGMPTPEQLAELQRLREAGAWS